MESLSRVEVDCIASKYWNYMRLGSDLVSLVTIIFLTGTAAFGKPVVQVKRDFAETVHVMVRCVADSAGTITISKQSAQVDATFKPTAPFPASIPPFEHTVYYRPIVTGKSRTDVIFCKHRDLAGKETKSDPVAIKVRERVNPKIVNPIVVEGPNPTSKRIGEPFTVTIDTADLAVVEGEGTGQVSGIDKLTVTVDSKLLAPHTLPVNPGNPPGPPPAAAAGPTPHREIFSAVCQSEGPAWFRVIVFDTAENFVLSDRYNLECYR